MHGSPVQLDELPNDGKPETESGVTSRRRAIGLAEALEHVWQKVRTDALACIDDPDLHVVFRRFDEDPNTSALRRELDRIREQIPDHLLESSQRHRYASVAARSVVTSLERSWPSTTMEVVERRLRHGDKIDGLRRQVKGSRNDSGHIQQVLDDVRQRQRVALDDGDRV